MSTAAFLNDLPARYRIAAGDRGWFAVEAEWAPALERAGYDLERDGDVRQSDLAGRKPLLELWTERETLLVRRFSHGGLLRFATGARFADPARPFAELAHAEFLRAHGIDTPHVVAARARRMPFFGYTLDLVTRRVPHARDLGHVLVAARRGEVSSERLRALVRTTGELIARLHSVGFLHHDLTPNNLLVREQVDTLCVLDLDRARRVPRASIDERRANLRRLWRFVERREARGRRALARTDLARFLIAYNGGSRVWKEDWRAILDEHERRGAWHRTGWLLEALTGRARDPRELDPRA